MQQKDTIPIYTFTCTPEKTVNGQPRCCNNKILGQV